MCNGTHKFREEKFNLYDIASRVANMQPKCTHNIEINCNATIKTDPNGDLNFQDRDTDNNQ